MQAILDRSNIAEHLVTQKIPERYTSTSFMRESETSATNQARPAPDNDITPIRGNVPITAEWTIDGDPMKTLELLYHDAASHRLSRTHIYIVMSWCFGRGVGFQAFYQWAMRGREDTADRHARYASDWKGIDRDKVTTNQTIFSMIRRLYPDVVIESPVTMTLIEYMTVKPTTVLGL